MFQRGGTATAMERLENFSDEVTEGRSNVRVDEERVEDLENLHAEFHDRLAACADGQQQNVQ